MVWLFVFPIYIQRKRASFHLFEKNLKPTIVCLTDTKPIKRAKEIHFAATLENRKR
jgi:hypothetical protein